MLTKEEVVTGRGMGLGFWGFGFWVLGFVFGVLGLRFAGFGLWVCGCRLEIS